jgi:hypothetical protein
MRFIIALSALLLSASAIAQTKPTIPQTGRNDQNQPFTTLRDLAGVFSLYADYSGLQAEIARALAAEAGKCGVAASTCLVTPAGATASQTLAAKLGELASPADFLIGASATLLYMGAIDAQPALTAYLAGTARSGLPCGTYRLDSTLTVAAASLRGMDRDCVTLQINFVSGDGIVLSGSRPALRNVRVYTAATRTSGSAVHVDHTYGAILEDIAIEGSHGADGILVDGANTTHINRVDLRPPPAAGASGFAAGAGVHLYGFAVDTHLVGVNTAQWHYGIRISDASGVFAANMDFVLSGQGVLFDPVAGQQVFGVQMSAVLGDTSYGDNWYFGGTNPITDVQIADLWASNSQTANGVAFVNPLLNGVSISNPHVLGNYANGMNVVSGKNISLTGGSITDNSVQGSAQADGINIGSSSDQVRIFGVFSGAGGSFSRPSPGPALPNFQRYGVNAGSGTGDMRRITIGMSQLVGNVTGGINMPTGTNIVNLGNSQ